MMTICKHCALPILAVGIAGCGSSGGVPDAMDAPTGTGTQAAMFEVTFETPDVAGQFTQFEFDPDRPMGTLNSSNPDRGRTAGYSLAWGTSLGTDRIIGVAGLLPETDPGAEISLPTNGATRISYYTGYDIVYASSLDPGTLVTNSGGVVLHATFSSQSVNGHIDGLSFNGKYEGTDITGTVRYKGVEAELVGVIGQDAFEGAFAGSNESGMLIGGFGAGE